METIVTENKTYTGCPWRKNMTYSKKSIEGLSQEIQEFFAWMSPTEDEHKFRCSVVQRIRNVVYTIWPLGEMDVYGSFSTLLYTPSSDIDIVIKRIGIQPVGGNYNFPDGNELNYFYDGLCEAGICNLQDIKLIDGASVPIIRVDSKIIELKFDFSFNLENVLQSVKLVENMCQNLPFYKPLTIVIKQFMKQNNLNKVYSGGISSYSLSLMCACFLCEKIKNTNTEVNLNNLENHIPEEIEEKIFDKLDLGQLLIEFLEFFITFDYSNNAIGWNNYPQIVPKESVQQCINNSCPKSLIIQDPIKSTNNVARGSFNLVLILSTFKEAYSKLSNAIGQKYDANNVSILGEIISISDEFVHDRESLQEKYKEMSKSFDASYNNIPIPQIPFCNSQLFYYNGFVNPSPILVPQGMVNIYPVHVGGHQFYEEMDYILAGIPSIIPKPVLNFNSHPPIFGDPRLNSLPRLLPPPTRRSHFSARTKGRNYHH